MSKRELKKYLKSLTKSQVEEQVVDLYARLKEVKTYYNFVFNPKEDKLLEEAKFKISKEYFPLTKRKPKRRRSVAQKIIRHYLQLGVESYIVADIMLYNIEVAQRYAKENPVKQISFYSSILKSYQELLKFVVEQGIEHDFSHRINNIATASEKQKWPNADAFGQI